MKDEFIRSCFVKRVIDGDTFDGTVDLGFTVSVNVRFRLLGYDAPEIWRPKDGDELARGRKVKARVQELIEGKRVTVRSFKVGAYNRWDALVTIEDGRDLTTILMDEFGGKK